MEPFEFSEVPTEILIDQLKTSHEDDVRIAIIIELVMRNDMTSINTLIELLQSENEIIQMTAIWALGEFAAPQVIQPLLDLLQNGDIYDNIAMASIDSLRKIGDPAVKPLLASLENHPYNEDVCAFVGETLAAIDTVYSFDTVVEFSSHEHFGVRLACTYALNEFNHPESIPQLLVLTRDNHPVIQYEALQAFNFPAHLQQYRATLLEYLNSEDDIVLAESIQALVRNNSLQDKARIFEFIEATSRPEVIQSVLHSIVLWDAKEMIPQLCALLDHKNDDIREWVAVTLGDLKASEAKDILLEKLSTEPNPSVMNEIIIALSSIGGKAIHDKLRAKRKGFSPTIEIERALLRLGNKNAFQHYLAKIRSHLVEDRLEAIWAFGDTTLESSAKPLIAALLDGEWQVRSEAVMALGLLKKPSTLSALIKALKSDEIAFVRQVAATAIGAIGTPECVPSLIDALRYDEEAMVRASAAIALGYIDDPQRQKPLIVALLDIHQDVRATAAEAIGTLKDPEMIKFLRPLLKDEFVSPRAAALKTIAYLSNLS